MTVEHDVRDLSLATGGRYRIEWAERDMRFCDKSVSGLRRSAAGRRADVRLPARHHRDANLMRTLQAGGADVVLTASNPLSTQDDVAAALVSHYEIPVYAIKGEDNATYYDHLKRALDHRPHVTMDDGADLVSELHKNRTDLLGEVIGGRRRRRPALSACARWRRTARSSSGGRGQRQPDQAPVRQPLRDRPEHD